MSNKVVFNIEKLCVKMIFKYPFFGAMLYRMDHIESERFPTAATDGKTVYYNRKFMETLTQEEQLFVFAHELLHAAFLHIDRFAIYKDGDPENAILWNMATDYLINDLLSTEQGMSLPDSCLIDPKYKFSDWTSEQLFKELKKTVKIQKINQVGSSGGAGSGNDMFVPEGHGSESEAEKSQRASEWKHTVNQAATIAKQAGNLPSSLERLIDYLTRPKVSWKELMRDWFNHKIKEDNNWTRPNRRFIHQGTYLPSKNSDFIGKIAVAIDTSGSIGEHELSVFGSELNYIFETAKPSEVHVIYCDCDINRVERFTPDDLPLKLKPYGGGGTSFVPPFNWIKKHLNNEIAGMVYMTDMCGDFPKKDPGYPVLWMATTDIKAPFGTTVQYNIESKR